MTKQLSDESQTNPPKDLLWRRIKKKSCWEGKNPQSSNDVDEAAVDFRLRGNDEYLSFFEVADEDEGRRVAAAFRVIRDGRPDSIDFIIFARQSLLDAGIEVEHKPDDCLPEFLSSRHVGTRGLHHEPKREFIIQLLLDDSKIVIRLKTKEIEQLARRLLDEIPSLRDHLGEHWRAIINHGQRPWY